MIISDLNQIEARVNVGEMDVVGIAPGQQVRLEVDAFKDRKFTGVVTNVANSAVGSGSKTAAASSSTSQQATQFEVRIRVNDKEPAFRPGMSVTAEIETQYRTNVLTVPLASVTTRPMKAETTRRKAAEPTPPPPPPRVAGTNSVAGTNNGNVAGKSASASNRMKPPNQPTWFS